MNILYIRWHAFTFFRFWLLAEDDVDEALATTSLPRLVTVGVGFLAHVDPATP